jgi:protein-tyrosine phosphatase
VAGRHAVFDLHGVPLSDGRTVGPARLLRASYVTPFDELATATLIEHGLTEVLDLRSPREAAKLPQSLAGVAGVRYQQVSIGGDGSAPEPGSIDSLPELYLGHVSWHGASIARAIDCLLDNPSGASLVHCQTGRDRTGIVVSLALRLAGAPDEAIVEHHLAICAGVSDIVAGRREIWIGKGRDAGYFDAMNSSGDVALQQAFGWIDSIYPDTEHYLRAHGGQADREQAAVSLSR